MSIEKIKEQKVNKGNRPRFQKGEKKTKGLTNVAKTKLSRW